MLEKRRRRAVGDRPAGRAAAPARTDPAGFHQHVQGARRNGHAADLLDLGARDRLVIGDDRHRLHGGARELTLLLGVPFQQVRQVFGGAECPLARHPHEIDAARGVERAQLVEQALNSIAAAHMPRQHRLIQRLGRGKQQRFHNAQILAPLRMVRMRRRQRGDVGGPRRWFVLGFCVGRQGRTPIAIFDPVAEAGAASLSGSPPCHDTITRPKPRPLTGPG